MTSYKLVPVEPTDEIQNIQDNALKAFEDLFNLNTKEGYPLIRLRPEVDVNDHVEAFREIQYLPYRLTKDAPTVQEVDLDDMLKTEPYCEPHYMCDDTYAIAYNQALEDLKQKYGKIYAVK